MVERWWRGGEEVVRMKVDEPGEVVRRVWAMGLHGEKMVGRRWGESGGEAVGRWGGSCGEVAGKWLGGSGKVVIR